MMVHETDLEQNYYGFHFVDILVSCMVTDDFLKKCRVIKIEVRS
jgi:hypothetical protein